MQISISTESILKQLYALSALRSFLTATPSAVAPFLTEDNRAGLIPVMQEALSHVSVDLLPYLQVVNAPNSVDDLIEIDTNVVNLPAGTNHTLETAIVERMLQILHAPLSETTARQYGAMAEKSTSTLRLLLAECGIDNRGLRINWNGY